MIGKDEGQSEIGRRGSWIPARIWLLFNTWFSSLIVGVSATASLHIPINKVACPIFIFCSGLAIALAIRSIQSAPNRHSILPAFAATLLILSAVIVILRGSLIKGEFVSVYPDPWSYSAFATYLRNWGPASSSGSQVISNFGSALVGTRYATPGLLALFAEISGTDACRSASLYAFLVLAQVGFGFVLLSRALGVRPICSLGAGLFGVTIGWAPEILKIGNWDQVLFVSLIPFALFRFRLISFPAARTAGVVGLGLCLAAAVFVYPEGAALSVIIYLPLVVWRLLRGQPYPGKIKRLVLASGVAVVLSAVYLPTFVSFLLLQISAGNTAFIAKGALDGLLSANWLPAIYCLGAQLPSTLGRPLPKMELIVGLLFVALNLVAIASWWRRKDGILLTIPFFLGLSLWQALLARYDYGLYKVLSMFWPVMVAGIFAGFTELLTRFRGVLRFFVVVAFCGLMAGAALDQVEGYKYAPWHQDRRIHPFLELTKLKKVSGDDPIVIRTQSWFNQMWAVFFLQGYKLEVANPLLNLRNPSAGLNNTEQRAGTLVLVDGKSTNAVWHNELFSLVNRSEPVEFSAIDAPNMVETVDGDQFIWLDNQFAILTIQSDADRQADLIIPEIRPGMSRPDDLKRTLILVFNGETRELPAKGSLKIPLTLKKGKNVVRLACKEHPTVDKLSSGDTRTLLLGIKGFTIKAAE
jgi:hypothetical protein